MASLKFWIDRDSEARFLCLGPVHAWQRRMVLMELDALYGLDNIEAIDDSAGFGHLKVDGIFIQASVLLSKEWDHMVRFVNIMRVEDLPKYMDFEEDFSAGYLIKALVRRRLREGGALL